MGCSRPRRRAARQNPWAPAPVAEGLETDPMRHDDADEVDENGDPVVEDPLCADDADDDADEQDDDGSKKPLFTYLL